MARELVQRKVDGSLYEFEQFGATHSLKILTKLTKLIGEPLTLAFTAMLDGEKKLGAEVEAPATKKSILDRKINGKMLGEAVKALVDKLDEDEVLSLVQQLCAQSLLCDGKKIIFDSHYEGRLGHLFKVLGAALEVQYGDFLGEMFASQGLDLASMSPARRT